MKIKKPIQMGIILMIMSSVFACFGQLFWKLSNEHGIVMMLVGFILYGIGAFLMLVSYKFGKLSVLQPILSLNYVISIFLGSVFLNETITLLKVLGVTIIIGGVIMIIRGGE